MYDYDLFTIGAGSGGVAATRRAGGYGARAAICEDMRVGGTCVLRGCIPKKLLVYAAHMQEEIRDSAAFGWTIPAPAFDWSKLIANKDAELDRLNGIYEQMLANANVDLLMGRGRLLDPHTVRIDGPDGSRDVTAETILIATGGWPELPQLPGIEHAISSNEALDLAHLPERIVIVGGGYIAVEFAGIFHHLGVDVTVVIRRDLLLRGFDHDVRVHLQAELVRQGIDVKQACKITAIRRQGDVLVFDNTDGVHLEADAVLFATGRAPRTSNMGLEAAGVAVRDTGAIVVDARSRTTVENIYAVGDCTDRVNLTPVAIAEGRALVETLYNDNSQIFDYDNIPSAVFSQPPIGQVGLTEEQARLRYENISIYRAAFRPLKNTISGNKGRVLMKMVVDADGDRVLGCHMVGNDAPEIIQGIAVALKSGATKADFDETIGIHPTAAEEFVTMYQADEAAE